MTDGQPAAPAPTACPAPPSGIDDVLSFWIEEIGRDRWFVKDDAVDALVRDRLAALSAQAMAGALDTWQSTPRGALALCILLDQVPRNLHRGSPLAFAGDAKARRTARHAVDAGYDLALPEDVRQLLYLPFEHSEDIADQQLCVSLFTGRTGDALAIDYAQRHLRVIERFGRFPHRNAALGRASTPDEDAYLQERGMEF
ncbi:MAG: DUF924 domain-containing protein [Rhodospirillaceae bacterium]|nr:DUF924 domain-containing protein [Rhodospirillaceae bacterium]